ncbi:MAG: AMP-binding protein [Clostridia bacterium]|nr:AMP-binding protein [Clostridia bacterium]
MDSEKFYLKKEAVDGFSILYEILHFSKDNYSDRIAFRQPEGKTDESSVTFSELYNDTEALRAVLSARGFKGKHIALLGETSYQWISVYLAVTGGIGVCVPIDKELSPETMIKQLQFAECDTLVCSARSLRKLKKILPEISFINTVIVMRSEKRDGTQGIPEVLYYEELLKEGKALNSEYNGKHLPEKIDPDETCVIIFTSGTTGANKGVCLSNRNIMGTLRGCARLLHYPSTTFSVLPVNHSYELHAHIMSSMYCGTTVCINDDLKNLVKNLERFKPEMSCMVPVMLELLVKKLKKQIADSGKEKTFYRMLKVSGALRKIGIDIRRRVFKDIFSALGGNLRMIICGGAPLSQDTADFLTGIGIDIYNGYGITECAPVVAVNPLKEIRKNSVGHILPTMKVRIASPDENGNGEIQLLGDNVMQGYYKAPEDTSMVFTEDGWFCTGDIGHTDSDGFLFINGRLKNLIILPNGKNVFPEEIEDALIKKLPFVKECIVYADEGNTGIYAILYPDSDFMSEKGLSGAEEIKEFIKKDMDIFNSEMPSYKRISDFFITDKEFEKSTTHKIQRFKIAAVKK